jgi:hypothetical protein
MYAVKIPQRDRHANRTGGDIAIVGIDRHSAG